MRFSNLNQMVKGWFVGGFSPSVFSTTDCEVAVKFYKAGDYEAKHYHKIATEITVVISGCIRMVDKNWCDGDIIILEPGEETDFEALTDCINVVVKMPGAPGDKYLSEQI